MSNLSDTLIAEAKKWIGVKELTNHNDGLEVEMFQKAVDGKAQGESWCMCFVQFCLQQTECKLGLRSNMYSSEHCLTVWNKTPKEMRRIQPHPGYVVIWQHGDTTQGHTGIVTELIDEDNFSTIEGNTGDGLGIVRDGDGVYRRTRSIHGAGTMKVVGFIDPFSEYVTEG
jgi:hypothetical protein